ncbi:hypothetical protein [uncultured Corynebacterium sp.]|nr:hypothetical protein [uncultured Corynebacterium sp.]
MDFAALLEPAIKFFSEGVGKVIADFARMLYEILYPANAEPAHPIEIPK